MLSRCSINRARSARVYLRSIVGERATSSIGKFTFLYATYCRYTYRPGGNRRDTSPRLFNIQAPCYFHEIAVHDRDLFSRVVPPRVVFLPTVSSTRGFCSNPPRSFSRRRRVAPLRVSPRVASRRNRFNEVPPLSLSLPLLVKTSGQSKSNLDSGAIKASATSHFTIRRVHMVYSTCEPCTSPGSAVRCIKQAAYIAPVISGRASYLYGKSLIECFDDAPPTLR